MDKSDTRPRLAVVWTSVAHRRQCTQATAPNAGQMPGIMPGLGHAETASRDCSVTRFLSVSYSDMSCRRRER